MSKLLKISFILASVILYSCITTKGADGKDGIDGKSALQNISKDSMKEKGFSKGTITVGKSTGCTHILMVSDYNDKLDPINLSDFFTSDIPEKVWVKHNNLRMMNRCPDARPVSIVEIVERKE